MDEDERTELLTTLESSKPCETKRELIALIHEDGLKLDRREAGREWVRQKCAIYYALN
jgi:hypothetical protein